MPVESTVQFSENGLHGLNAAIFLIMLGVSLGLDRAHFGLVLRAPRPVLSGLFAQFALLPALTALLVLLCQPTMGVGLGMLLVAACPGGSVSNYLSVVARANVALSISLSAMATVAAAVMTPLNFSLWSSWLYEGQASGFALSFWDMLQTLAVILVIPVALGQIIRYRVPKTAMRLEPWFRKGSFLVLMAIIAVALLNNRAVFLERIHEVAGWVALHNAVALCAGYGFAALLVNGSQDCRTIAMETGIQNSGLGLIIIFTHFGGNSDMALVAAWWGIWHIVAGGLVARWWRRTSPTTA